MSFLTRRIVISVEWEAAIARRIAAFVRRVLRFPTERSVVRTVEPSPVYDRVAMTAYLDELDARFGIYPAAGIGNGDAGERVEMLLLDGSAFVALARGDTTARRYLRTASTRATDVLVAASSLADPKVCGVAERVARVVDIDERIGNEAARLVAETRLDLPLDALTVACAPGGVRIAILTTDPAGLSALVRATGRTDLVVLGVSAAVTYFVSTMRPR